MVASRSAAPPASILLIADLSGYTGYLISSEIEEAPAIAGDLVETMLGQLTPVFELAGLEGDAAFLHAPLATLDGEGLLEAIGRCHRAFRQRIESLRQATTCECEACRRVPTLDLKFFVHVGPVVRQRILGREELAGRDVIVVHRLLKDSQPAREGQRRFALLTDAAVRALGIDPVSRDLQPATQTYEHLGEIPAWSADPEAWAGDAVANGAPVPVPSARVAFRISHRIAANRATVWDLLTVPELRERWEGIEQIEEESADGPRGLGTLSRCVARRLATVEEIVEWRPPMAFARRVQLASGEVTVAHRLAESNGQTDLEIEWHPAVGDGPSQRERREFRGRLQRLGGLAADLSG
jgi:uncharacterized protein YndB with AHSA1/START domain